MRYSNKIFFFILSLIGTGFAIEEPIGLRLFLHPGSLQQQKISTRSYMVAESMDLTPTNMMQTEQSTLTQKSKGKAFLLSLILPGLGERYVGSNTKAQIFMATEVSLWLSYAGFVTYRDWRKQDYKTFAAAHASVELRGKSDSYFIDLGNYQSIYDYNAAKLRQRNLPEYYTDVETYFWNWDSSASRARFEQLRISADKADNRALFAIGAILANHVISAIDAIWSVTRYNRNQQSTIDWGIRFGAGPWQPSVNLSLSASF